MQGFLHQRRRDGQWSALFCRFGEGSLLFYRSVLDDKPLANFNLRDCVLTAAPTNPDDASKLFAFRLAKEGVSEHILAAEDSKQLHKWIQAFAEQKVQIQLNLINNGDGPQIDNQVSRDGIGQKGLDNTMMKEAKTPVNVSLNDDQEQPMNGDTHMLNVINFNSTPNGNLSEECYEERAQTKELLNNEREMDPNLSTTLISFESSSETQQPKIQSSTKNDNVINGEVPFDEPTINTALESFPEYNALITAEASGRTPNEGDSNILTGDSTIRREAELLTEYELPKKSPSSRDSDQTICQEPSTSEVETHPFVFPDSQNHPSRPESDEKEDLDEITKIVKPLDKSILKLFGGTDESNAKYKTKRNFSPKKKTAMDSSTTISDNRKDNDGNWQIATKQVTNGDNLQTQNEDDDKKSNLLSSKEKEPLSADEELSSCKEAMRTAKTIFLRMQSQTVDSFRNKTNKQVSREDSSSFFRSSQGTRVPLLSRSKSEPNLQDTGRITSCWSGKYADQSEERAVLASVVNPFLAKCRLKHKIEAEQKLAAREKEQARKVSDLQRQITHEEKPGYTIIRFGSYAQAVPLRNNSGLPRRLEEEKRKLDECSDSLKQIRQEVSRLTSLIENQTVPA